MALRDPIAYLVIKIWIKSKLPKIALQPKIDLLKTKNPKAQLPPKWAQKERSKIQPKQPKGIGSICNLVTACFVRSIASIGHIFLISTLDCDPFEALDSWPPKLQNYIWFSPRKWLEVVPILAQSWCSLCSRTLRNLASIGHV